MDQSVTICVPAECIRRSSGVLPSSLLGYRFGGADRQYAMRSPSGDHAMPAEDTSVTGTILWDNSIMVAPGILGAPAPRAAEDARALGRDSQVRIGVRFPMLPVGCPCRLYQVIWNNGCVAFR